MLYFIIFTIYIVVNLIIAYFMKNAAELKGYDSSAHAFGIAFWFGIWGAVYVCALPDLKMQRKLDDLIELQSKNLKKEQEPINTSANKTSVENAQKKVVESTDKYNNGLPKL